MTKYEKSVPLIGRRWSKCSIIIFYYFSRNSTTTGWL